MEQADLMYEAIKQKILDLEVDPVQPIEDKALVRDTGGSLTLVRQALDRLSEDGLVEKLTATVVCDPCCDRLYDARDL